jgi:hypothetical protein
MDAEFVKYVGPAIVAVGGMIGALKVYKGVLGYKLKRETTQNEGLVDALNEKVKDYQQRLESSTKFNETAALKAGAYIKTTIPGIRESLDEMSPKKIAEMLGTTKDKVMSYNEAAVELANVKFKTGFTEFKTKAMSKDADPELRGRIAAYADSERITGISVDAQLTDFYLTSILGYKISDAELSGLMGQATAGAQPDETVQE